MSDEEERLSFNEGDVVADLEGQDDPEAEATGDAEAPDDAFHCFTGHSESVFCVAWSPVDVNCVASGGQDDCACLWTTCDPEDPGDALSCRKLEGHSDSVISVAFNHDGQLLASAGMDGLVKIWSMEGGLLQTLEGPDSAINWICWHPKGNVIMAGTNDYSTWMWNADTADCMQVFCGHGDGVTCGTFTPDGKTAVTTGDDGDPSLKIWNPRTAECAATVQGYGYHEAGIISLDVASDGLMALTGSVDHTARLCNLSHGQPTGTLSGHEDSVETALFVDGVLPVLLTGSLDGKVMVWDRATLARRQVCEHPDGVVCMARLDDSSVFVTGCMDGCVRVWDARISNAARELRGCKDAIQCIAANSDPPRVMSGSDDAAVRIYDLRS